MVLNWHVAEYTPGMTCNARPPCKLHPNPRARPDLNWNCTAMVKGARLLHGNKSTLEKAHESFCRVKLHSDLQPRFQADLIFTSPRFLPNLELWSSRTKLPWFRDAIESRGQIKSAQMPVHPCNLDEFILLSLGALLIANCGMKAADGPITHTSVNVTKRCGTGEDAAKPTSWGSNTSAMRTLLSWPEQTTQVILEKRFGMNHVALILGTLVAHSCSCGTLTLS